MTALATERATESLRTVRGRQQARPSREAVRALSRRLVVTREGGRWVGLDGCRDLVGCGLPLGSRVRVVGGRGVGPQFRACGSGLRCGWCGPFVWRGFAERAVWWGARHVEAGGWFGHSVLSVPHWSSSRLARLLCVVRGGWRRVVESRPVKRSRKLAGFGGGSAAAVVVLHVKWSPGTGFHAHLHVLWLCGGDVSLGPELGAAVSAAWVRGVKAEGWRAPVSEHGAKWVPVDGLGHWEFLWQKHLPPDDPRHPSNDCAHPDHEGCWACELQRKAAEDQGLGGGLLGDGPADPWAPSSRADHAGGFEVFSQVGGRAVDGCTRAAGVLREYLLATRGERRVVWPTSLGARLGVPPVRELTAKSSADGFGAQLGSRLWFALDRERGRGAAESVDRGMSLLGEGLVVEAAEVFEEVVGGRVVFDVEQGEPLLRLPSDREGVQVDVEQSLSGEGVSSPAETLAAGVRARIGKLDPGGFADDLNGKGRGGPDRKKSALAFDAMVVGSGQAGLIAEWQQFLVRCFEVAEGEAEAKVWGLFLAAQSAHEAAVDGPTVVSAVPVLNGVLS